jgi:hypothetical protein
MRMNVAGVIFVLADMTGHLILGVFDQLDRFGLGGGGAQHSGCCE